MPSPPPVVTKGVSYSSTGEVLSCLFCRIVAGTEPSTTITHNLKYIVFKNIRPVSNTAHYLVAPREHIQNLSSLRGAEGARVVAEMVEVSRSH
jgi:histidine triad (HIT) family protein